MHGFEGTSQRNPGLWTSKILTENSLFYKNIERVSSQNRVSSRQINDARIDRQLYSSGYVVVCTKWCFFQKDYLHKSHNISCMNRRDDSSTRPQQEARSTQYVMRTYEYPPKENELFGGCLDHFYLILKRRKRFALHLFTSNSCSYFLSEKYSPRKNVINFPLFPRVFDDFLDTRWEIRETVSTVVSALRKAFP